VITVLLATGLAQQIGVSSLLASLFLGMTLANLTPDKDEIVESAFIDIRSSIFAVFFTLAGARLHVGDLAHAWQVVLAVFAARALGKVLAGHLSLKLAGATDNVRRYLGMALVPQAGVAVGLLLKVRESPLMDTIGHTFIVVGVATVALNEIIGPLTTRWALKRSGDLGKDRPRLIDFILEPNIVTGFKVDTKEEAIGQLVDLLMRSHRLTEVNRDALVSDILRREKAMSTCVGRGMFLPHAEFEGIPQLLGVMAISGEGLPFETPDGLPVHCITLLVVPPDQRQRHLEVLAALARSVGSDPAIQLQLFHASSPAHVHEILHAEEFEDYNYFLEEDPV